ncbi:MAG: CinA family protein [Candidatus Heimdallarchaeaceae archaeon]
MNIEKEIGYILIEKKWTLSTAESCSGGHIADKITNVSGSSKYFFGGLITYSIETKIKLLGIEKEYFDLYSVYSSKVAEKMAENVRKKIGTTFGIAVTGIAPPGDEDSKKAVGTVFVI